MTLKCSHCSNLSGRNCRMYSSYPRAYFSNSWAYLSDPRAYLSALWIYLIHPWVYFKTLGLTCVPLGLLFSLSGLFIRPLGLLFRPSGLLIYLWAYPTDLRWPYGSKVKENGLSNVLNIPVTGKWRWLANDNHLILQK